MAGRRKWIVALLSLVTLVAVVPGAFSATTSRVVPFKWQWDETTQIPLSNLVAHFDCSGVHIEQKLGWIKESETCLATGPGVSQLVAGTYTSTPSPENPNIGRVQLPWLRTTASWGSDFDHSSVASIFTLIYSDNLNSTFTLNIVAYFPKTLS